MDGIEFSDLRALASDMRHCREDLNLDDDLAVT
jgi:hypothetical protein